MTQFTMKYSKNQKNLKKYYTLSILPSFHNVGIIIMWSILPFFFTKLCSSILEVTFLLIDIGIQFLKSTGAMPSIRYSFTVWLSYYNIYFIEAAMAIEQELVLH